MKGKTYSWGKCSLMIYIQYLVRRRTRAVLMVSAPGLSRVFVTPQVLRFALRTDRQAIARGWARFAAATDTSTAGATFAEGAQKMTMMEAHVVDLQQKVQWGGRQPRKAFAQSRNPM